MITIYPNRGGVYEYFDRLAIDPKKGTTATSINPLKEFTIVKVADNSLNVQPSLPAQIHARI
jgi:hypothetical protein